jgi:hypothetical protein
LQSKEVLAGICHNIGYYCEKLNSSHLFSCLLRNGVLDTTLELSHVSSNLYSTISSTMGMVNNHVKHMPIISGYEVLTAMTMKITIL